NPPSKKHLSVASHLLAALLEKREAILKDDLLKERLFKLNPTLRKEKNSSFQSIWNALLSPPPTMEESPPPLPPASKPEKKIKEAPQQTVQKQVSRKKTAVLKPSAHTAQAFYEMFNPLMNAVVPQDDFLADCALLHANHGDRAVISRL